jgi:DNA polymerase III subunit alpha
VKFVNLHHHSTFSFGDGFGTPAQHVARAVELGYTAIAMTEHGNVSSHWQLEKAAVAAGIKPIFGMEAYCGPVTEEARQQFKHHLTILAADISGYRSLSRLVTQSYKDYYYNPTVSGDSLRDNSEGLFILSGCSGSMLACALLGGKGTPDHLDRPDREFAASVAEGFAVLFPDRYYIEVQPFPELERTCIINENYEWLANELGLGLVVTNDVHYPRMEDAEMQAVLHAVHRGKHTVEEMMREWNYAVPLTLPESDNDLYYRLRDTGLSRDAATSAILNSALIAESCNVSLPKAERLRYPITEEDLEPWR